MDRERDGIDWGLQTNVARRSPPLQGTSADLLYTRSCSAPGSTKHSRGSLRPAYVTHVYVCGTSCTWSVRSAPSPSSVVFATGAAAEAAKEGVEEEDETEGEAGQLPGAEGVSVGSSSTIKSRRSRPLSSSS